MILGVILEFPTIIIQQYTELSRVLASTKTYSEIKKKFSNIRRGLFIPVFRQLKPVPLNFLPLFIGMSLLLFKWYFLKYTVNNLSSVCNLC